MRVIIFLLFIFMVTPQVVMAQNHNIYCKDVDTTAASQECLKQHLKSAQSRLNEIYEKLKNSLEADKKTELQNLQNTWLTYRDSECMWEVSRQEQKALKHVYELSCMARITEDRADLLTTAYGDNVEGTKVREFGDFPKWMNALAKEKPETYWKYGNRIEGDLNCDGQIDYAMVGMSPNDKERLVHLAIVEDPIVGIPKSTQFTFPATIGKETTLENCTEGLKIQMEDMASEQEKEAGLCYQSLTITSKLCPKRSINWSGKNFIVGVEHSEINKKESKEKK